MADDDTTTCEIGPEPIVVQPRDTWGTLVEKYGEDIASRNGLHFGSPLHAGTVLL